MSWTKFWFVMFVTTAGVYTGLLYDAARDARMNACPEGAALVIVAGEDVPGGFDTLIRTDGGWAPQRKRQ